MGIETDLFGFDGFKSSHYWDNGGTYTTHAVGESDFMALRPNIYMIGCPTYPYDKLYNFCHANHHEYDVNVGLDVCRKTGQSFKRLKILELGAGNGRLSANLVELGNSVTALEVSQEAFDKIPAGVNKLLGGASELPFMKGDYDMFISIDVLEHLTEHDIRLTVREAARLCRKIFVCVSNRPSGLVGPNGENLHLTVKPAEWWRDTFSKWWNVSVVKPGPYAKQTILEGNAK
jgi:SAM-dependent methyltransferase